MNQHSPGHAAIHPDGPSLATLQAVIPSRTHLAIFALSCGIASAAALAPLPDPKIRLPVPGLEANRGQAKPEILFLSRVNSLAITARSILFDPLDVRQNFVASNPNPMVRFVDPLPGVANSLTGRNPQRWVTGIPRYASAVLAEIYPGVDAQYKAGPNGELALKLLFRPGVDPQAVVFEIPEAVSIALTPEGLLVARLGSSRFDPALGYDSPVAFQEAASGRVNRTVNFVVQSTKRFGFQVDGRDGSLPLEIEMKLQGSAFFPEGARPIASASGYTFIAATIPDAAGKDAPFPDGFHGRGCASSIGGPIACTDVAVYKLSQEGELIFVTYLEGRTREDTGFLQVAPDGTLMLAGSTDSSDFPVTPRAFQPDYGGPAARDFGSSSAVEGDFFAVRLDPESGIPLASTYLGGPNADTMGEAALGEDGSLYFIPKWLVSTQGEMPVTAGAILQACPSTGCGYAAHLSPSLDELLYGTYLPGRVQATAKLHSDGSVYYAGADVSGFPTTPTAHQPEPAGEEDGIVARLNPQGSALIFATYVGGDKTDWILRMAVSPDGSVWVAVSSFVQCCFDIEYRLVRLDANGEGILADVPIDVGDVAVDPEGNLLAIAAGAFPASPDAFLAFPCSLAYIKLSPIGELLFATYLPAGSRTDFYGTSDRGLPILRVGDDRYEIVEGQEMGVFTGCATNIASAFSPDELSPGAIVSLYGSKMGPPEGAAFQLENGRLPATLAGTRVLVNGEPVPLLMVSYWQVNAILPYSLDPRGRPRIQVVTDSEPGNELANSFTKRAWVSLFRLDDSMAAALNEDGTLNSPANPAAKGSTVMLFGTGGGTTTPPSTAGEVTPLELRRLDYGAGVEILGGPKLTVEYAGAAPGLVAGVIQINVRLPEVIPEIEGYPPHVLPLRIETPGIAFTELVTIAVSP